MKEKNAFVFVVHPRGYGDIVKIDWSSTSTIGEYSGEFELIYAETV